MESIEMINLDDINQVIVDTLAKYVNLVVKVEDIQIERMK
jgi:hypothetical protein